jgi:diguanylate cyclase (GGDEF)-like protein
MGMGLVELPNRDRLLYSRAIFNQTKAVYRALLENLNSGYILCQVRKDQYGNLSEYVVLEVNPAFERQLGFGRAEVIGRDIAALGLGACTGIDWPAILAETAEDALPRTFERHSEVLRRWFRLVVFSPLEGQLIVLLADITRQKELEEKQQRFAYRDLLTGLSSQRVLEDRLMLAIAQAKRSRELLAIALSDVENYEACKKECGPEAGEELLQELARRTVGCLRQSDTVARIGANTFALILAGVKSRTNSLLVANRVLEACRQPFPIRERIITPTGNISLCFFPHDQQNFAETVSKDEVGMYLSKERKFPQVCLTF